MAGEESRNITLHLLIRINEEGVLYHLALRDALTKANYLPARDKALIKRITSGAIENLIKIDYIIDLYSKTPVEKMKPLIRNLLRMSVYQIIFMDNIPDRAACDEAVKLAVRRGFSPLKGFVNGILRNISRNKEQLEIPSLSIRYSIPEWLAAKFLSEYDDSVVETIFADFLTIKPLTVRICEGYTENEQETWVTAVRDSGFEVNPHPYLNYAYEIQNTDQISRLSGYNEGFFAVQDVSSMMVCEALGVSRNDVVLDVCAAPGGKALHISERVKKVIAYDLSEHKCSLINENAKRLKRRNVEISVQDATIFNPSLINKADIVLADVPCSGLGVIGKKPDIKYRLTNALLNDISDLQKQILATVWQYVKPNGILLYSTCTINNSENEKMMDWFIANYPFVHDDFPQEFNDMLKRNNIKQSETDKGMLKLLPGICRTDGFFICRLKRKS
ncbi:MAG: 16S rRNA (cytosine(967)-C(5))-methyltransferase RsmB [Lachnospiraceae bacterium]|nr:16S rRNA (cytosine(967)-C(5))-methyltransferase RsmB [Lachnospiraceae bacterium]